MSNISPHITYAEAVKSNTAQRFDIDNTPGEKELSAMKSIALVIFEPLRDGLGNHPIAITSFYRSPVLNYRVGSSMHSQHIKGRAMDLDADVFGNLTNLDIFNYIRDNFVFDQLIWEFDNPDGTPSWVHVSYNPGRNRRQVLKSAYVNNILTYYPWPFTETNKN
jgi:zinc D-Ala-D-Ala carboxypeptidase